MPTTPAGPQALAAVNPDLTDRYIVVFQPTFPDVDAVVEALTRAHGGAPGYPYYTVLKGFAATLPAAAVEGIRRNPNVAYVEPDGIATKVGSQTSGPDVGRDSTPSLGDLDGDGDLDLVSGAGLGGFLYYLADRDTDGDGTPDSLDSDDDNDGLLDTVVPPEASEEWVEALKRHDKVFEYKTYDDEPHGFLRRENLQDVYERMEQFLDWYLLPR